MNRIAALHDLSCFGRCALTVILPALSAMGTQVVPLPTALLSSHTGGFTDLYFKDLTEQMREISDHFERLELKFDAIYTGFLGSEEQIDLVSDFINKFSDSGTLRLVDPVMGDDGEVYSTYTEGMCRRMAELCRHADLITPNLTEACILAGVEYKDTSDMSESEAFEYADGLRRELELGHRTVVITGISHSKDSFGTYGFCPDTMPKGYMYSVKKVKRSYPGTGDLFASVLLGALMAGADLCEAMRVASDHIRRVMEYSRGFDTPPREGVAFESFLGELCDYAKEKYGRKTV
ncbi:MAG: pyridoxamine kinase [Ruminococcaceae bacterium]|nr:pyridoxamine kinase [Oscillospiraceae bacterium]